MRQQVHLLGLFWILAGSACESSSRPLPSDAAIDHGSQDGNAKDAALPDAGADTAGLCALCASGTTCAVTSGAVTCTCAPGYTGDGKQSGTGCSDVDECTAGTSGCVAAAAGGTCANTTGGYTCGCAAGYTGDGTQGGTGCNDVDECTAGTSGCVVAAAGGTCANTTGGYACGCAGGYTGDGTQGGTGCNDVDECTAGTSGCVAAAAGGTCANTTGGYACGCAGGYTGDGRESGTGCSDVDECTAGTSGCVAAAGGGTCANTTGGYTCGCADGYTGDGRESGTGCSDVDECTAGTSGCVAAAAGGTCANTTGGYTCGCATGLVGDGAVAGTGCRLAAPEVLWYRFDGSGTTVPNLASSPPSGTTDATIAGGQSQSGPGTAGRIGQCDDSGALVGSGVSGASDHVNTGWATSFSGSWTISFWSANVTPSSTLFYIFGDTTASSFRCFTNGVAGPSNWILRGTGITDVSIPGGATVAASVTTFVYDQPAGVVRGYLDGELVTTVAQTTLTLAGNSFKVGAYSTNVGLNAGGLMDEFRVYSRALSGAEVGWLANASVVCAR